MGSSLINSKTSNNGVCDSADSLSADNDLIDSNPEQLFEDLQGEGYDPSVETPITPEVIKCAKKLQMVLNLSSNPFGLLSVFVVFAVVLLLVSYPSLNSNLFGGYVNYFHLLIVSPVLVFEVVKASWLRYVKTNAASRLDYNGYQYKGSWFVVSHITGRVYSLNFLINKDNCC